VGNVYNFDIYIRIFAIFLSIDNDDTVLMWHRRFAVISGDIDRLRILIQISGEVPSCHHLHHAVMFDAMEITKFLLSVGCDVNAADLQKRTALMEAVKYGRTKICEILLQHNADVNARDINNSTALHEAALSGETEICTMLLDHGAMLNAEDKRGITPLYSAVMGKHPETVRFLLRLGADPMPQPNNSTMLSIVTSSSAIAYAEVRAFLEGQGNVFR